jgi:hypothetical protein
VVEVNFNAPSSSLSSATMSNRAEENHQRIHKQAYGKNYSIIERVYTRRKKEQKGKTKASPSQATGRIRAKKATAKSVRAKRLGKALASTPETSDGLRRSPRISSLLDGHKVKPSSSARIPRASSKLSRSSLQGAPEDMAHILFPGPVKFPSLTDLEKMASPYPPISTVALQEKATQCGVPPEEVSLQLLQGQVNSEGKEGSSRQNNEDPDASNAESF